MTLTLRALLVVGYGLAFGATLGCSDNITEEPTLTASGGAGGGAAQPLAAVPGLSRYALVGETVTLDGSASTGAESYQWHFGDGRGWDTARSESTADVVYDRPGRYQAVLTVFDAASRKQSAGVTISVTHPLAYEYGYSTTLLREPDGDRFVVVSSDADQLVLVERQGETFAVTERVDTCDAPRTVALFQGYYVTACPDVDRVSFHPRAGGAAVSVELPYGSGPFGVAAGADALYASLRGSGKVARFVLDQAGSPELEATFDGIEDGRALAVLPDGRIAVARMRSPDEQGEVMVVDPTDGSSKLVTLAFDTQVASDAEIGGVPSYLSQIAVSPTGREALIPSLMANVAEGAFRSARALAFDTTIRAALSKLDLEQDSERLADRIQFDELGFAEAVAFSQRGDYAFVVMPGTRSVVKVDLLSGTSTGAFLDAGYAPDGASVTHDDRYLFVNSELSRELAIYDLEADSPMPVERVALLDHEPLTAQVLLGKKLFNDSADPRIAKAGYIACAHCHLDGDSDGRTWDFTDRGEGLRNTISLLGRAGTGDGPIHWSGNFDEIQDFEHDIRNAFGGTGLMDDSSFHQGSRDTTLGDAKAGVSAELDALAAYCETLTTEKRSPFRNTDGSLTPAAARGKLVFESPATGCTSCHVGARMTDSVFLAPAEPLLHDVGTLTEGSGKRLGGTLTGIDTPTLHGLWHSGPYLHDGSAATLEEVLRDRNPNDEHGVTSSLSDADLDDLVQYLLSLDGALE